jgi:glycosyltransferase involved in cell wall biosynthesis
MKILIDARSITSQTSGIGRYTNELIKGYIKHWGEENVTVILNSDKENRPYKVIYTNLNRHKIFDSIKLHFLLKTIDFDIYHATDLIGPLLKVKNKYYIISVHDIMYKIVPNFFGENSLLTRMRILKNDLLFRNILRCTNEIISVSETTRNDLHKNFKIDSIVIREGVNKINNNCFIEHFQDIIPNKYFLYVGSCNPHKNVQFLIDSFLKSNTNKQLVISGKNNLSLFVESKKIIFTGFVTEDELDYLYKNCYAFVFPSLYEGFGLPILEALSYGKRVFSSTGGALKEFSNEVVCYFNPYNKKELIKLIENADNISVNSDLINTYLKKYDWENIWDEFHYNLKNKLNKKNEFN